MIYSDKNLAQKIERAEALSNVAFVESRAAISPESGARWIDAGGAFAMFDGANSPCSQSFGLGLFAEADDTVLDKVEAFYKECGAPVMHEVCPLAGNSVAALLNGRGYQPFEMSNVLYLPLVDENKPDLRLNPNITTRIIEPDEVKLWAKTSADGWSSEPEMEAFGDFMFEFGQISARSKGGFPFLAELEGEPISTGMMFVFDDVALFAGASTVPVGRKKGGQTALLDARLRFAAERGCTVAVTGAMPGSQSQRNAEKNNFRIAYTRTKWMLRDESKQ
jgi:hypothetical protein